MSRSSAHTGRPACRVGRTILLTIMMVHLLIFLGGLGYLASKVGGLENALADIARERYTPMFLLINLHFLLGYAVVSAVAFLVLHPLVRRLAARRPWPRLTTIGLTLCGLIGLHGFFILRAFSLYPGDVWVAFDGWFTQACLTVSGGSGSRIPAAYFDITWQVGAILFMIYYARKMIVVLMARRTLARVSVTALILVALSGTTYAMIPRMVGLFRDPPEQYNILILSCDSLRGDHLSCNGYSRETTPNIDGLASQSINFQKAFVPTASTTESWVSLMTGQYPQTHGLRNMFPTAEQVQKVETDSPLLPKILRKQGYTTAAFGDWAGAVFNALDMGYEERPVSPLDPQSFKMYLTEAVLQANPVIGVYFNNAVGHTLFPDIKSSVRLTNSGAVTHRVIRSLRRFRQSRKPFLISAFYSCTHLPYGGRWPYNTKFTDPNYDGPNKHRLAFDIDDHIDKGFDINYSPAEIQHIIDLYDGSVNEFDDNVGRILQYLKESGMMDNTIILITSDHGENLYEGGTTIGHGSSFTGGDQNNHVPQVLYLPPSLQHKPRKVEKIVRSIDVAPTLLELLKLPVPEAMDGQSLVPYITGDPSDLGLAFYGETSYLFFREPYAPDDLGRVPLSYGAMDKTLEVAADNHDRLVLKQEYQDTIMGAKHRVLRTEDWKLVHIPSRKVQIEIYRLDESNGPPENRLDATGNPKKGDADERNLRSLVLEAIQRGESFTDKEKGYRVVFTPGAEQDVYKMYRTTDLRNEHNLIRLDKPDHPKVFEALKKALDRWRRGQGETHFAQGGLPAILFPAPPSPE